MDNSNDVWQDYLEHAELSDVGLRRSNNQDSMNHVLAGNREDWERRGHLFMVADGMGAHAAGELASKLSADNVPLTYYKLPDVSPAVAIQKAVEDAHHKIHSRGISNPDFKGMGTTTSVLLLLPQGAVVAHVGDSRVYRLRGNRLEQLSFDHSLQWEMMAHSKLRPDEVPPYVPKNIITRSLGPNEQVKVDLEGPFPLAAGDTFLLCSDGLSGPVQDEELGVIMGCLPPVEAVRVLVDLANLRGGPDNITVIIARVKNADMTGGGAVFSNDLNAQETGGNLVGLLAWITSLGLLAATGVMAMLHNPGVAWVTGLLGAAAGAFAIFKTLRRGKGSRYRVDGKLGNGPHTSLVCNVNNEFVDKFAKIVTQLKDAAVEESWTLDWHKFNGISSRALSAAEKSNYVDAVREYCHAISFMMNELRNQRTKRRAGPPVELEGH
jgi:serine/threonine protein phosphatase PrpC